MIALIFTAIMSAGGEKYMRRCLELAANGIRAVPPNPMVGAVLVHEGEIISEGYHKEYGGPHAEVEAIRNVPADKEHLISSSTLYVNLEPCSHYGKTPPCADLIVEKNIPEVVIASLDPNPLVAGKGMEKLKELGIAVTAGLLQEEAEWLNRRFYTFHLKKRPYIILKWAESRDGYTSRMNEQTQVSNALSQRITHKWRSEEQAIMIGANTARIDNPRLNVRHWKSSHGLQPLRIVVDPELVLPQELHLFTDHQPTLVVTHKAADNHGDIKYISVDPSEPLLDRTFHYLYENGISSVFVEGGAFLHGSIIDAGLWDEIRIFTGNIYLENGVIAPAFTGKLLYEEPVGDNFLRTYKPFST